MKNNRGVTLIELLVVIAIVGILAVALGFSYVGWQGGYNVESAVKQLQADLMSARTQAMATNSSYVADFPTATTYRINTWNDADNDGVIDAGETTPLATFPKTLQYSIFGGVTLSFDKRGLISQGTTPVLIDPAAPVSVNVASSNIPDYNCILISQSRINIGLMAAGVCNAK